jgi:hypothetical protein
MQQHSKHAMFYNLGSRPLSRFAQIDSPGPLIQSVYGCSMSRNLNDASQLQAAKDIRNEETEGEATERRREKEKCEDLMRQCRQWQAEYPHSPRPWYSPKRKKTAVRQHEQKRKSLLMKVDRLAVELSRENGWEAAVQMVEQARNHLANDAYEAARLLNLWREPPE